MEPDISTDPDRLDVELIHRYLSEESYWARGIPREVVERSIANSLCFGVYVDGQQVGFARVVTDRAVFAYLADVFILAPYRGHGYGKALVKTILAHPDLQDLRSMVLFTRDAHLLYAPHGFETPANPERIMVRRTVPSYQAPG